MTIPEVIKIGGKHYKVEITDKLDLGIYNCSAETLYEDLIIRVSPQAKEKMEADFIHEVCHAALYHLGYREHDEKCVDEMAHVIYAVIQDNPDMFTDRDKKNEKKPTVRENVDKCVTCGAVIPEGRQVCKICEDGGGRKGMSRKVNTVRFINSSGKYILSDWICYSDSIENITKDACGEYLSTWTGAPCAEAYPALAAGLRRLQEDPERYRYLETGEEWGSVEAAIELLKNVCRACRANGSASIIIERE